MPKRLKNNKVSRDLADAIVMRTVDLDRVAAGQRKQVLGLLRDMEIDLRRQLQESGITKPKRSRYRRARLEKLLRQTEQTTRGYYDRIAKWEAGDFRELYQAEFGFFTEAINDSIGADVLTVAIAPAQLKAIASDRLIFGAPSSEWWRSQADGVQREFDRHVRIGMAEGEGIDVIVRRIVGDDGMQRAIAGDVVQPRTAMMKRFRRNAEALVRSSVLTASNNARFDVMSANKDLLNGYEQVSTLDGRTTAICRGRDGLQWTTGGQPIGHDKVFRMPPLHWNCRSAMSPIVKSWEELSGVKIPQPGQDRTFKESFERRLKDKGLDDDAISKIKANARASLAPDRVGPVTDKTYEAWLRKRPESFQREVLGSKRKWELWESGKITQRDLTDQRGNELTIPELEAVASRRKAKQTV